jgi:hypothetical protein
MLKSPPRVNRQRLKILTEIVARRELLFTGLTFTNQGGKKPSNSPANKNA